jgi:putative exporter of polyketide antibiotics
MIMLAVALVWIVLSVLVALVLGSILRQRDTQLAADNTACRQLARSVG